MVAHKWREWVLLESESRPFFARLLEAGINFFDTADMYSLGASKMNHLEDALSALEIELTQEECQRLEEPYQPHPVLGHR